MALVLTISMETVLKERAAWVASFIYDRALGDQSISLFSFFPFLFFYSIIYDYSNIHIFIMSVGSFLPREISESFEIPEEMMESLAWALEVTAIEGLESSIPVSEVVIPMVRMEIQALVSEANVPSASTEMIALIIDEPSMLTADLLVEPTLKEMEPSTPIPGAVASTKETEILTLGLEASLLKREF